MCSSDSCANVGTAGPNGVFRCRTHIVSSLIPPAKSPKVKFEDAKAEPYQSSRPKGLSQISDPVLFPSMEAARNDVFADQFNIVAHLTQLYGGDLVHNALGIHEITTSGNQFIDMKRRLGNLEVSSGGAPIEVPPPHMMITLLLHLGRRLTRLAAHRLLRPLRRHMPPLLFRASPISGPAFQHRRSPLALPPRVL